MSNPSIVHIGLPLDHPSIPDKYRGEVEKSLNALRERMRGQGYGYELAFASPESGLAAFRLQLEASPPDAIVIGGGVMGNHDLRYFTEQIIDVTHAVSPRTKILLIDKPDDVAAAVLRWFPRQT